MLNAKELLSELQDMRDQGFLSDALMRHAVKGIGGSDDRYDWVGVFLVRESGEDLWLHNYVGAPAELAEFPVGVGVCGKAVVSKTNQIIPDVAEVENYLVHSPDTRSELVVLIRAGDDVFGAIDVDCEEPSAFSEKDEKAIEAIADKLAEQLATERR